MKNKKKFTLAIALVFIISIFTTFSTIAVADGQGWTIRGYVYYEGVPQTPDWLKVIFPSGEVSATLPDSPEGYYQIDQYPTIIGQIGEIGYFKFHINGADYYAVETVELVFGEFQGYRANLTICEDVENPSKVTGLEVTDTKKGGELSLSWDEATDTSCGYSIEDNIKQYNIYRDGAYLKNVTGTSTKDNGLENGVEYFYTISAVDKSNNEGEQSDNASGIPTKQISGDDDDDHTGDDDDDYTPPSDDDDDYTPPIINEPPVAKISGPSQGNSEEDLTFDGLSSTDDGTIESYEWDLDNDDQYDDATGETVTHSWTLPAGELSAEYTISLRVTDNGGKTGTVSKTITIIKQNNPPTIPSIAGPTEGETNTEYSFTITSTDPDNDTLKFTIEWDDGNTTSTDFLPNGTIVTESHIWTEAGTYTITVTVDDNSTEVSNTHIITISEPPEPEPKEDDNSWIYYLIALIIIVILLALFLLFGKKKKKDEKPKNKK